MEIILDKIKLDNGETMGYRKVGEGNKLLILVHGNMTSSKHWDLVMENMPNDFTTIAIDMRGFGISTYNTPVNSLKDFSEDLKSFVNIMGIEKFHLLGWSTGGGVAMEFAAKYPENIEKLILVESVGIKGYPIFRKDESGQPIIGDLLKTKEEIALDPVQVIPILSAYENKDRGFLKYIWDATIYTGGNKPEDDRYEEYIDDMLTQRNLVDVDYSLAHFNMSHEHNGIVQGTGDIDKIKAPTLVIQGDKDLVVPMEMAEGIAKAIGENAKLEILENGGHSPMVDDISRFMNLILNFMK